MNLLSKAIEFTEYGKIVLEVRRKREGRILFKVISYGSSMQSKLAQQMKSLSPTAKKLWRDPSSSAENSSNSVQNGSAAAAEALRPKTVIKNLEALSLEISQILCHEMGTRIIAKNVEGKLSQLKFAINDGFVSTRQSSAKLWKTFRRSITNFSAGNASAKETTDLAKSNEFTEAADAAVATRPEAKMALGSKSEAKATTPVVTNSRPKSLFSPPCFAIPRNDSMDQMAEIPNEIAATSPINIPSMKNTNLIESLYGPAKMPVIPEGFPCPPPTPEQSKPLLNVPPKVMHQPSFRTNKMRRVTLVESAERHARRIGIPSNMDDVQRCSILVVDDDAINRRVLKALLKKFGHNSIEARDGKEAVSLIESYLKTNKLYELTLIFMDLQMPILDGVMATKKILELCDAHYAAPPPIVGVTADPVEEDKGKFLRAGLREMLSKPIDVRKIEYVINKYIRSVC